MTLEEAIKREEEQAQQLHSGSVVLEENKLYQNAEKYRKMSEEHRQLAEWLNELKELRAKVENYE